MALRRRGFSPGLPSARSGLRRSGGARVRWVTQLELDAMEIGRRLGRELIPRIRQHAARGERGDGSRFPPLSPAYARRKAAIAGSSSADFRLTGDTLRNLQLEVRPRRLGARVQVKPSKREQTRVRRNARLDRQLLVIGRKDLRAYARLIQKARVWREKRV